MAKTDTRAMNFTHDQKDDGSSTFAVHWYNGGIGDYIGVWVRYNQETSHKEAFSMLCQGMWEALQDEKSFVVSQEERGGEMTVEPYWDGLK